MARVARAQRAAARRLGDPRVAVEYGPVHELAGSIRMYETLPYFSGRATLEGVYNQAATTTHPVYYLASELFARSPNPFRKRRYSSFDPESALERLRLFNVSQIVAVSPELALGARRARRRGARGALPPYTLYRLKDPGPGYVEPLAFAPVRADPGSWRDASYRWFSRKPANRALLVFTHDARFDLTLADAWAPPPERPLPGGVSVAVRVEAEELRITTSRPGHPLLVKMSFHPRWRAEGADGPYLVSPGLMLIVPRQAEVRLDLRGAHLGRSPGSVALPRVDRRGRDHGPPASAGASAAALAVPGGRGGPWVSTALLRILPLAIVAALAALRFVPAPPPAGDWKCARRAGLARLRRGALGGRRGVRASRDRPRSRTRTRGAASFRACAARRCCGRGSRASRPWPSSPWSRRARARTGRKRSSRERPRARPPATGRAPPRGAAASGPSIRAHPGLERLGG